MWFVKFFYETLLFIIVMMIIGQIIAALIGKRYKKYSGS